MNTPTVAPTPSIAQVLTLARSVIAARSHWTKGANARDEQSQVVSFVNKDAASFCMAGAKYKALRKWFPDNMAPYTVDAGTTDLLNAAARQLFPSRIQHSYTTFNDHPATTHKDVLAVYDLAINMAGGGKP